MTRTFILATRNADKVLEIERLFRAARAPSPGSLPSAPFAGEDEVERHESFVENAVAKATFFASRLDRAVLAEDSGLAVDFLGGAPGVRSKRWAGAAELEDRARDVANNDLLLERLRGVRTERRTARYVCAAAAAFRGGEVVVALGTCSGRIAHEPRGDGGFGYDPLFVPDGWDLTFAELGADVKEALSHRGRAWRGFLGSLPLLGGGAKATGFR